jgi:hypothetical protein
LDGQGVGVLHCAAQVVAALCAAETMVSAIKIPLVKVIYDGRSYIDEADTILAGLSELIPDLKPGETITLKRVDLTTSEYEALPEFEGW